MHYEVEQVVEDTLRKAEGIFGRSFNRPLIQYDLRGQVAGKAIGGRIIKVNTQLLRENKEDYLSQTLPHEVAHIIQRQIYGQERDYKGRLIVKSHGPEWKNIMRVLGLEVKRCHSYKTTPARKVARVEVRCDCQTHIITMVRFNKMQRGTKYQCRYCRSVIREL
jgi:SprT protein